MPVSTAVFGMVAGGISLVAYVPYIVPVLRGKSIPNQATWLIWTILGALLATSYYASGAEHTLWVPASYVMGSLTVVIVAVWYGRGGWTATDYWCLVGVGIGVALWWLFNSPLIATCIFLFIDVLGAIPTIRRAYQAPESESPLAWALFFIATVVNLFAIDQWTFALAGYPVCVLCVTGTIAGLVVFPRRPSLQLTK